MNHTITGTGRGLTVALTALCAIGFALLGVLAPVAADCPTSPNRSTHLLCAVRSAQPLTPLLLVALPLLVVVAVIATNQAILFSGPQAPRWARPLSRLASLSVGPVMVGLGAFTTAHVVVPHLKSGAWLGVADVTSTFGYLLLVGPAAVVTMVELRLLGADRRRARQLNGVAAIAGLLLGIVVVTAGSMSTAGIAHTPTVAVSAP